MAYNFKEVEKNGNLNGMKKVPLMPQMIIKRKNGMD